MDRRSRIETYMDILKAVAVGRQKPTHIMYRANLCWGRLIKNLDFLVKQDLLKKTHVKGAVIFSLTPRGKDVLGYFKKVEGEIYNNDKTLPTEVYVHYK